MRWLLLAFIPALVSGQTWTQPQLDEFARTLDIKWVVKDNLLKEGSFSVEITITNKSPMTLTKAGGWSLYLGSVRLFEPDVLARSRSLELEGQGMKITHLEGSHFRLEPTSSFIDLPQGRSRKVKLEGQAWIVDRSSVLPNWYLAVNSRTAQVVQSTVGEELSFVETLTLPQQVKRYTNDLYSPFTVQERYRKNHLSDTTDTGEVRVIPKPLQMTVDKTSSATIANSWNVYAAAGLSIEETFLRTEAGLGIGTETQQNDVIRLSTGDVVLPDGSNVASPDAYTLAVDTTNRVVEIVGKGRSGVFYGIQTLLSLMSQRTNNMVYKTIITDSPRFEHRGLLLDVVRNFHTKADVLRLLLNMATYKLNRLHLHLSEDEGWRLQIPGLEDLTDYGSKRCHSMDETRCVYPQLGSGPDEYGGFYTRDDYREILQAANNLHITVVPEFDMPGHSHAAIRAMEVRYNRLVGQGQQAEADRFRLVEEGDTSKYMSVQLFTDNAMNPCMESTYTFINKVLQELVSMHEGIQPLKLYHFGGDEVAHGAWKNSTKCRERFGSNDVSVPQVKEYFFRRMANITFDLNLNLGAWEDGLVPTKHEPIPLDNIPNEDVYAYAWDTIWEDQNSGNAYDMANKGYKVVMIHANRMLIDHPYEPDPEERGYYWARRYTDTKRIFGLTPDNLYALIDTRVSGQPITRQESCGENDAYCPTLQRPENIAGLQACLWSELIRTPAQMDSQLFPRILALAERAWHKASWEGDIQNEAGMKAMKDDWESFAKQIGRYELSRMDKKEIKYRIPPPGAVEDDRFLKMTTTYPGLMVEYSRDEGATWHVANGNVIVRPKDSVLMRTRSQSVTSPRYSRVVKMDGMEGLPYTIQSTLDYMAENLDVKYKVLDNFQDGVNSFLAQATLNNTGDQDIAAGNWGIYYCSIYPVVSPQPDLNKQFLEIEQVRGCIFKFQLTSKEFKTLKAGQQRKLKFQVRNWSVSKTDMMPNWYVWSEGFKPRTITSTAGPGLDFVQDFTKVQQWKRYNTTEFQDWYDPYTPEQRLEFAEKMSDGGKPPYGIIPTPVWMVTDKDLQMSLSSIETIYTTAAYQNEADYLKAQLSEAGYTTITVSTAAPSGSKHIELISRKAHVPVNGEVSTSTEAYVLTISPTTENIKIWGESSAGIFYGIQSLLSLGVRGNPDGVLYKTTVEDAPRFAYRGQHMDTSRNFHSKEDVLKLLKAMAMYKLNKFHFHLTDDEGWRLEIPGLPELTQIGGMRCHDLSEESCIITQLGSGPDTSTSGSGFYTVADYTEILTLANSLHIEVIPEIDSPGHAHAAIFALKARRKKLMDLGDAANANMYNLVDDKDKSVYSSVQMFTDNAINPCMPSTYTFFRKVIDEIIEMHRNIQPLKIFHFGGDEVAAGAWLKSPECEALLDQKVFLKELFTQSISNMTSELGLNLGGWEDGLMKAVFEPFNRSDLTNNEVLAYAWDNVWEWGVSTRAYTLANEGYKVVLAHATHLYFDHPYEPDPEERGYYWATRFADTYKTFGYMPDTIYENVDVYRTGAPFTLSALCGKDGKKCVPLEKKENIIGMQGHIWSETIRTDNNLWYMVFPRLVALAERAWHKASWEGENNEERRNEEKLKDFNHFINKLGYKELPALDKMGITYRVPLPGASLDEGRLRVVSPVAGLLAEMSTDGGLTWKEVIQNATVGLDETVHIALKSSDGKRRGRAVTLTRTGTPEPITTQKPKPNTKPQPNTASTCQCSVLSLFLVLIAYFMTRK